MSDTRVMMLLYVTLLVLLSLTLAAEVRADAALIEQGRKLFFEQTFEGNGRTCGTCHPATNNFTIDPPFIRTLKGKDPLFVAKKDPDLSGLEIQKFLKNEALILENLDTFGNPGVMRGVPHTLALGPSAGPASERMGWSGDGSPGDGSLRSFAIGAVTQHFPKTLARRSCTADNFAPELCDFRLPTKPELDALEAFQLSLGRQEDIDLAALEFDDETVEEGRALFFSAPSRGPTGTRSCNGCHVNAGTNDGQRATGANHSTSAPACLFGFRAPADGGEGLDPVTSLTIRQLCGKGPKNVSVFFRGNGAFNTPPVIKAADTPPFFHNNSAATIEYAVKFYTSDTFNDSVAGGGNGFLLDDDQIKAVAALLRSLNVLENIRSATAYATRAADPAELAPRKELVELSIAETTDAIEVLTEGPIKLFPDAADLLKDALVLDRRALKLGLDAALLAEANALRAEAQVVLLGG